jgi:hypothetical protein
MKVMLQRDWFAPGDLPILYLRRDNPSEVDESLLGFLPSGAQIQDTNGAWLTRRETRKRVLKERLDKKLDAPRNALPQNAADHFTDEELLQELDGKSSAPKGVTTTKAGPTSPPPPTGKTIPVQATANEPHTDGGEKVVHPVNPIPSGGEQSKVVPVDDLDDDATSDNGLKPQPGKVTK